ncbi:MAG: VOC family protein [Bdellovibrionota bacterium]
MITENVVVRIARPAKDLTQTKKFYHELLGLPILGEFIDHDGFDGLMIGFENHTHHLEFTVEKDATFNVFSHTEDLIVFYIPDLDQWSQTVQRLKEQKVPCVPSSNPYWDLHGLTFEDPNGYRVVLCKKTWEPSKPSEKNHGANDGH